MTDATTALPLYEVVPDQQCPDTWRVEFIDGASEGEVYTAVFLGPNAEPRAREYAEWMNTILPWKRSIPPSLTPEELQRMAEMSARNDAKFGSISV